MQQNVSFSLINKENFDMILFCINGNLHFKHVFVIIRLYKTKNIFCTESIKTTPKSVVLFS